MRPRDDETAAVSDASPPGDARRAPSGAGAADGERAARTARLVATRAAWRRLPAWQHALAVLALALLAFLAFGQDFLGFGLEDENIYVAAFERLAAGGDPYGDERAPFLYLPVTAVLGAWSVETFGDVPVRIALRLGNLLALAAVAWLAAGFLPWDPGRRFVAAAVALLLHPGAYYGLLWSNLSLLAGGMIVVALLAWPAAPVAAGLTLGLSVIFKPMAPGAVAVVGLHRPAAGGQVRAKWTAAVVAGVVVLALLPVGWELYDSMLAYGQVHEPREVARNASLYYLLGVLGLPVHALPLALGVALAAPLALRRLRLGPVQAHGAAVAVMLLTLPLIWSHTVLVVLPTTFLALAVAADRRRRAPDARRRRRRLIELAAVAGLGAALYLSESGVRIEHLPRPVFVAAILVPILAPSLLAAYVIRHTEPF